MADMWLTENGLPQNTVTCITQTRDGYLWLGTLNGLARFDGMRFVVFGAHNTPEIKSNRILCLLEDSHGGLWIGTEGGGNGLGNMARRVARLGGALRIEPRTGGGSRVAFSIPLREGL